MSIIRLSAVKKNPAFGVKNEIPLGCKYMLKVHFADIIFSTNPDGSDHLISLTIL